MLSYGEQKMANDTYCSIGTLPESSAYSEGTKDPESEGKLKWH
jgi:hypothetical protein